MDLVDGLEPVVVLGQKAVEQRRGERSKTGGKRRRTKKEKGQVRCSSRVVR